MKESGREIHETGKPLAEPRGSWNEENWGLRKSAYPIDKKTTGFYQLVEFKADPSVIATLELNFRRDERVIRAS